MYISSLNTFIGKLWLEADKDYLQKVSFTPLEGREKSNRILEQAKQEISEYTNGLRRVFTVPFKLEGSEFQLKVWNNLLCIPYGKVWSYHQLAEAIGYPNASRAVGNANHKNPLPIIIPCHRVISSCGDIGGYGGGREVKQKLLDLETMTSL